MEHLVEILVPIACGCVLPIVIVWLAIRKEMNDTNTRTQIVLAAIEKNPDLNIEDLMKKIRNLSPSDCHAGVQCRDERGHAWPITGLMAHRHMSLQLLATL